MANPTLPDVTLSNSAYVDIYALTGIPLGTPLILQNKSTTSFYVQEKETAPSATNIDGNILQSYSFFLVNPEPPLRCFVRGNGRIAVQIA